MAQTSFLNATVDPSATVKVDRADHRHTLSRATAAAGDFTVSYDPAKVTTRAIARSMFDQLLRTANDLTGF